MLIRSLAPTAQAANKMNAALPAFPVTVNGQVIDNNSAQYPLFLYKDITYVPMTYDLCRFLGLVTVWDAATDTFSLRVSSVQGAYVPDTRHDHNSNTISIAKISCNVAVNGILLPLQEWQEEQYPLVSYNDIAYFPLTFSNLMYHHFDPEISSDTIVSSEKFREQMTALKEAGYTTTTLAQLLDFVENGTPLPNKPVLVTMDDGYTSNLEIAAPILEELGMCATVFVIGINEGEELYAHSGQSLQPARFSYEDAAPWVEKGVLDLQSHSMDMHQLEGYGYSKREGMLPLGS